MNPWGWAEGENKFLKLNSSASYPTNRFLKRSYSSIAKPNYVELESGAVIDGVINPWVITGLIDAEGTFTTSVLKSLSTKSGYNVAARFKITLHIKDLELIKNIQSFFGEVGTIVVWKDTATYRVDSLNQILDVVIPHFDKYPLITQKLADYLLFKDIISLMKNKEHLTLDGFRKVLSIKASLNLGLSPKLKVIFPEIKAVNRPLVVGKEIPSPFWIAGFTSGDGSFYLTIRKKKLNGIPRIDIGFQITQHSRDMLLLEKFTTYFNCGKLKKDSRYYVHYFIASSIKDISQNIIPFFKEYKIIGTKSLDFTDFCKAVEIIKSGAHLTKEGVDLICEIQNGMNSKRSGI
jgi:hypothetical protein